MGWDSKYLDDTEQKAAADARARAGMTPFERMLLDQLAGLALVLERVADQLDPIVDADLADEDTETRSAPGDGCGASAEPGYWAGSARPHFSKTPDWLRDLLKNFDDWLGNGASELPDDLTRDELIDAYLRQMTSP